MAKMSSQHELFRIIVGNQIAIMRALGAVAPFNLQSALSRRTHDTKAWWRHEFGEEVGFMTDLGDGPPKGKKR